MNCTMQEVYYHKLFTLRNFFTVKLCIFFKFCLMRTVKIELFIILAHYTKYIFYNIHNVCTERNIYM